MTAVTDIGDCVGMPITEFLMHRDSMLLLDELVACEGDSTACEWRVEPDDSFVEPGEGVPAYVGVEFMAQCVAVHAGCAPGSLVTDRRSGSCSVLASSMRR